MSDDSRCPACGSTEHDGRKSLCPYEEIEHLRIDNATHRRLSGQANYLLARVVAAATLGAVEGDDGFIQSYNLPVGPIHKAIPFLNEQGIIVTNDGQIKNGPDDLTGYTPHNKRY